MVHLRSEECFNGFSSYQMSTLSRGKVYQEVVVRRTRLVASLAVAGAASASLVMLAAPAMAYPPKHSHHAQLSRNSVSDGGSITGSGSGFSHGERVDAYVHSVREFVGDTIAGSGGVATLTFTVPANLPAGAHTFELVGETSGVVDTAPFTVTSAGAAAVAPSSSGSSLPFTGGSDVWQMTVVGIALVAAGGGLLVVRRRRTHIAAV
jgi:LPXTG-motif cell wall-anchored protein